VKSFGELRSLRFEKSNELAIFFVFAILDPVAARQLLSETLRGSFPKPLESFDALHLARFVVETFRRIFHSRLLKVRKVLFISAFSE